MKSSLLLALILIVTPSLFGQTSTTSTPPIPEEARRHFVMGTTMFKEAKAPGDFVLAEAEFKQATDLAPQWPDARYNLALAKEAAGDIPGAMADLKLYQQFKLNDAEARAAQDKIYALEAKQKMVNDEKYTVQGRARAAQRQFADLVQKLDGTVFVRQADDQKRAEPGYPTLDEVRFYRRGPDNLLVCQTRQKYYSIYPFGKYTYEWMIMSGEDNEDLDPKRGIYPDYIFPAHADGGKSSFSDFRFADNGEVYFAGCRLYAKLSQDGKTIDEIGAGSKTGEVKAVWNRQ